MRDPVRRLLEKQGWETDDGALERLSRHHDLLLTWNRTAHLVSAGDASRRALVRHDLEALQALPYLAGHHTVVDVGSGGGFPALVWACMRPDLSLILVESGSRKAAFLREAAHRLALNKVRVLHERLEDPGRLVALAGDLWTSRAAGCGSLLRLAGESGPAGLTLILYAGAQDAGDPVDAPVWDAVADEPLVSGAAGRLVVLRRRAVAGSTA
ncbi:MAG: 16S rRNA (guanine(527)-N(7))-methyltransferase RsmG [Acidobacteria bacterium]|nr:16S rRNA (guanine(527)-N(7))-methyltransferase RsmG [Acidobacteriota bacterium]